MQPKPLKLKYLKDEIIIPVLKDLALLGKDNRVINLLLGTCAQESELGSYRRQIGLSENSHIGGFGIYQIELATDKLVNNWLEDNRPYMLERIKNLYLPRNGEINKAHELMNNDKYATAIARVIYLSILEPLPGEGDIAGMAKYWKKYYNRGGKGKEEQFIGNYKRFVQ
jgi:hypothetical protein